MDLFLLFARPEIAVHWGLSITHCPWQLWSWKQVWLTADAGARMLSCYCCVLLRLRATPIKQFLCCQGQAKSCTSNDLIWILINVLSGKIHTPHEVLSCFLRRRLILTSYLYDFVRFFVHTCIALKSHVLLWVSHCVVIGRHLSIVAQVRNSSKYSWQRKIFLLPFIFNK